MTFLIISSHGNGDASIRKRKNPIFHDYIASFYSSLPIIYVISSAILSLKYPLA